MILGGKNSAETILVVAEIGNNHEGDVDLAEEMIALAAQAGADAVKFQTFKTPHYVSHRDTERFERLQRFELSEESFRRLRKAADRNNIAFISTAFDLQSAAFLIDIADAIKIASGDNTFYPLLQVVAASKKPMVVSTGMLNAEDLTRLMAAITTHRPDPSPATLALLHCVSRYPTPLEEANLGALIAMRRSLPCTVGYSDHCLGIEAAKIAACFGARIVEKHFTLDKNHSDFRDHRISADPDELRRLVDQLRIINRFYHATIKTPSPAERAAAPAVRRSIVAARDLPVGHQLQLQDLDWVRPGGGLPPGEEHRLIDRRLKEAVSQGDPLSEDDVN